MFNYKTSLKIFAVSIVVWVFAVIVYPQILIILSEVKTQDTEIGKIKYRVWIWDKDKPFPGYSVSSETAMPNK